jgi:2'-5' RNA ligase
MEDWSASGRTETALVLLIPEAEPVVGGWRTRYDPAAGAGVPAHVTLLYPFLPPERLTSEVLADLRQHFAEEPPLSLEFSGICAFPNALYLAPEPQGKVDAMIARLLARYPQVEPYGGAFEAVVPHLTVAQPSNIRELRAVVEAFCHDSNRQLPIRARVERASLLEMDAKRRWREQEGFPLLAVPAAGR